MNTAGNSESLIPSHPGNTNAVAFGVFSPRALAPRAREIAEALMAAPHTRPLDQIAAEEIGSIVATLEAIDADLHERGFLNKKTREPRTLLDYRLRMSARLERWLKEFGATPASRAAWVEAVTRGGDIVSVVRDQIAEGQRLLEDARQRHVTAEDSSQEVVDERG